MFSLYEKVWFISIMIYVTTNKYDRKVLILYDDEKKILDQLCHGKIYQKEIEGFSENLVNEYIEILINSEKIIITNILLLIGIVFTFMLQSSAAVTTIIIQMVGAGIAIGTGGNSILFVILGTNIGTCLTSIISSIGASANAKRASLIHLLFNVFGALIFTIVLLFYKDFMADTFGRWFASSPKTQNPVRECFRSAPSAYIQETHEASLCKARAPGI